MQGSVSPEAWLRIWLRTIEVQARGHVATLSQTIHCYSMNTTPGLIAPHFTPSIDSKPGRAAIRERIAPKDATLEKLEWVIRDERLERQQRQDTLNSYQFPIHKLPHELLSEVFVHTLHSHPGRPTLTGDSSPYTLGLVCRKWYQLMVKTPRLWARFDLEETQNVYPRFRTRGLPVLERWLTRSGACPLSIRFFSEELDIKFFEALLRHATRWQDVDFEMSFEFFQRLDIPTPMLHKATLDRTAVEEDKHSVDAHPLCILTQAPKLETMVIKILLEPMSFALPLSQITTLDASVWYPDVFKLLSEAPALEICELELWPPRHQGVAITPIPISLPHLRSLSIISAPETTDVDEDSWSIQGLCGALTVPALQDLTVEHSLLAWAYDRDSPSWLYPLRSSPKNPSRVVLLCQDSEDPPHIGRYQGVFPDADVSVLYGFVPRH